MRTIILLKSDGRKNVFGNRMEFIEWGRMPACAFGNLVGVMPKGVTNGQGDLKPGF